MVPVEGRARAALLSYHGCCLCACARATGMRVRKRVSVQKAVLLRGPSSRVRNRRSNKHEREQRKSAHETLHTPAPVQRTRGRAARGGSGECGERESRDRGTEGRGGTVRAQRRCCSQRKKCPPARPFSSVRSRAPCSTCSRPTPHAPRPSRPSPLTHALTHALTLSLGPPHPRYHTSSVVYADPTDRPTMLLARAAWARAGAATGAAHILRPARRLFSAEIMDNSIDAVAGLNEDQVQVRPRRPVPHPFPRPALAHPHAIVAPLTPALVSPWYALERPAHSSATRSASLSRTSSRRAPPTSISKTPSRTYAAMPHSVGAAHTPLPTERTTTRFSAPSRRTCGASLATWACSV